MESIKGTNTRSKSTNEKTSSDSDMNGEKASSENEEVTTMEVVESEVDFKSEENDKTDSEKPSEKIDTNSEKDKVENNGELLSVKDDLKDDKTIEPEKKTRKRKISEIAKEEKNISEENIDITNKEVIEDETSDQRKEDDKDTSSDLSMPSVEGLGKGKRARIPNKRYSDIALSPSVKAAKSSYLENGEKEKEKEKSSATLLIERIESETSGTSSPTPKKQKMSSVDLANPNFLKPFKFGWKRELVWRSVGCDIAGKRNGDIYYYSPEGKKLRSMREVAENLKNKDLSIGDFTFFKEPLGLNDPEKEIIRDAKIKSAYLSSSSSTKKASTPKPKKTVSPKVLSPKIASPKVEPPPSKPLSPKIGSPRVNLTKLDISEEGKNLKSSKTINAATTKGTNTTADSGSEGKAQKASTLKVKIGAKAKTEKKVAPSAKQVTASSEEDTPMPAKKVTPRKPVKLAQKPVTSESSIKPAPTPKKRTLKLNNITNTSSEKSNESHFMENYLQNLSYGYNTLLYVFQYLKVQDLLRAGCVCTMWKDIASHPLLWRTVRMKNSQVHSFEGLANTLQKHGTVQLDLRKMLLTNCDEVWPEFSNNIGKVDTLRKIELCRCPAFVVERLTETNPKLEVVNAVTIRCEKMNLAGLANWTNLRELRLKSTTGLTLESDIESLRSLVSLKSLSLTSIKDLNNMKLDVISDLSNLESLDLGECTDFPKNFGKDILSKLKKLEKLRLEKGQGSCHTFEMLDAVKDMHQLEQLELVNFDIKAGFDKALGACKNIKKLLIIPTYISQSATTNHMVLGGVLRLQKSLSHFVWGVTLELLRVTELFVDQCEEPEKKEKKEKKVIGNGDSIPVLKPVPLITDDKSEIPPALDPPQVEILALPGLQKLLLQSLPTTRVKILKIPFHATWRQSITDAVN
ncbi:hypothetical protein HHI36_010986 [Cryptolaemus montrouzieri]|uniref:MBD domain-containing protein n=1 Tax=Cryptolaemus montrouzieri TaxID=559131 RepID=A0ABD2MKF3_9CUCU